MLRTLSEPDNVAGPVLTCERVVRFRTTPKHRFDASTVVQNSGAEITPTTTLKSWCWHPPKTREPHEIIRRGTGTVRNGKHLHWPRSKLILTLQNDAHDQLLGL